MIRVCLVLRALLLTAVLVAPAAAQTSTDAVFPGEEWEHVGEPQLAAYGWDAQKLNEVFTHLRDDSNSTGVVVVDRGRVYL